MLDDGPFNRILMRGCIKLLQSAPFIEGTLAFGLTAYCLQAPSPPRSLLVSTYIAIGLFTTEVLYALTIYRPHKARLASEAKYPEALTPKARWDLFERCLENIPDRERYLRIWFLDSDSGEIKRDNVKEFLLWAFFDRDLRYHDTIPGVAGATSETEEDAAVEVEKYLERIEELLDRKLPSGYGSVTSLRLTIDSIETKYRPAIWYGIVGCVDFFCHVVMSLNGFRYYAPSLRTTLSTLPPRVQGLPSLFPNPLMKTPQSASPAMGYWFRPHTSKKRLPVVFLHGIGIGIWPYLEYLTELNAADNDGGDGEVGLLVLEIMPVSMRLTSPLLPREQFLSHITSILAQHGAEWEKFILASHSYGSVLTTHMLRSPTLGPRIKGLVLVDPVSILLHLPDVAYNFTRRRPQGASEWQLWYFASMDLGIAEGLGRHFFWRENIIWREELQELNHSGSHAPYRDEDGASISATTTQQPELAVGKRKVAVFLAGKDIIVDTKTVARYLSTNGTAADGLDDPVQSDGQKLSGERQTDSQTTYRLHKADSGISIGWLPQLDHAQVFEHKVTRKHVVDMTRKLALKDE